MGEFGLVSVVMSVVVVVISWAWYCVWWKPKKMEKYLREQGITGPPYRLLFGNLKEMVKMMKESQSKPMPLSHDIVPRVIPYIHHNIENCGKMCVTWIGTVPEVNIMDPELIKEILSNKFGHFGKPIVNPLVKLFSVGLANLDGEKWAKHRRIVTPAFHLEKLKRMLPAFYTSCEELVCRWEKLVSSSPEGSCELNMWAELQNLAGDVISRTAFGSSFDEGRRIFILQNELSELVIEVAQSPYLPGFRFLPTKRNTRMKQISREVEALIRGIINKREEAIRKGKTTNSDDLLGLLMESNFKEIKEHGNSKNAGMSIEDVIKECKLFYFAGQETTSVLLVWTMVVLSIHPEWQQRAREEILQVFGKNEPHLDGLNRLKTVTMILHEVLRLYSPLVMLSRRVSEWTSLGGVSLPPGVKLSLLTLPVHHDREAWGEDAKEFKPERFADGVSKATKHQASFFPFGGGPRFCIGQNFAMIEAKMGLSMILQNFSFKLSPSYTHSPCGSTILKPQHGAQIILHKL